MIMRFEYWCLVMILTITLNLHSIKTEDTSNASEPSSTAATSTSTTSTESEEKEPENTSTPLQEPTTQSSLDAEPLNKYRRNGLDLEYMDRWEDDKKRYMLEYGNQFEDDYYPYRERGHFHHDKIFPVRIQGCPHYSRDVSRDDGIIRSGILQGWLGAAKGAGTRGNEDKRLEMSPFYVTTATPKTAPSYRNHANSNKPYADYENNYDKQSSSYAPNKPKYSGNSYRVKGSASKDYYNLQGSNYADDRNVNSWQFPHGPKNNRVIYYEYNLDDNRRPENNGYPSSDHFTNYHQCDVDYEENSRRPTKNNYYYSGNRYQQHTNYGGIMPQSRYSTNVNQDSNDKELNGYYSEDGYQNRNIERADHRNPGYEFNLPFSPVNNDKPNFPPVIPTTLSTPRTQFMAESGSVVRDKNAVKSIPFPGHRFHFQPNNI